jgi:hypothetical protein
MAPRKDPGRSRRAASAGRALALSGLIAVKAGIYTATFGLKRG